MAKVALCIVSAVVLSLPIYAQPKTTDYAVKVHLSTSHIGYVCGVTNGDSSCKSVQQVTALIDGAKYELQTRHSSPRELWRSATIRRS